MANLEAGYTYACGHAPLAKCQTLVLNHESVTRCGAPLRSQVSEPAPEQIEVILRIISHDCGNPTKPKFDASATAHLIIRALQAFSVTARRADTMTVHGFIETLQLFSSLPAQLRHDCLKELDQIDGLSMVDFPQAFVDAVDKYVSIFTSKA